MNEYFEIIETVDRFNEIKSMQKEDDLALATFLSDLVEINEHKKFNFSLLNVGTMLQTISIFFEFKKNELDSALQLEKEKVRDRRMREIVKEMNEKINLRYELDEDTRVVQKIYIYNDNSYLLINKSLFINSLFDIKLINETNISQL